MPWYLIHTKPRQEARALLNLERQGYACYLPMLARERLARGVRAAAEEPLLPRYLFIRLDADGAGRSWAPIRSTKGVSQMVTFGGEPAKVSETLVAVLRQREAEEPRPLFVAGERLTIDDGPFSGFDAVYEMPDGDRRAMVLIELLGKITRLTVSLGMLSKPD